MTTEERMKNLEKKVLRQRRWNIALGVMVVAGGLMAAKGIQEAPDVIRAKKFEVVNDEGKVLVEISNLQGGGLDNGMVQTRTSKGTVLVQLQANKDGGVVSTKNATGQSTVRLSSTIFGGGMVSAQDGKGVPVSFLFCDPKGNGGTHILNKDGKRVAGMQVENGIGVVDACNQEEKRLVAMLVDNDGGILMIADENKTPVGGIAVEPAGYALFGTFYKGRKLWQSSTP